MPTLKEIANAVRSTADRIPTIVGIIITPYLPIVDELIKDQLRAGIDGNGIALTPSYLDDPFFTTPQKATAYMMFKSRLPLMQEYGIFPMKDEKTPNLTISGGDFYNYIRSEVQNDELIIKADGSPIFGELQAKYGAYTLELHEKSKEWLRINKLEQPFTDKLIEELRYALQVL